MERLTFQEEEAMLIVWQVGEGTIREYHQKTAEPHMPYTTFASIIGNLERKGFVSYRRIGLSKLCKPAIAEADYKRSLMKGVIDNYFQNSYKELVSFFAKEENISSEELKEIVELIERGKKK